MCGYCQQYVVFSIIKELSFDINKLDLFCRLGVVLFHTFPSGSLSLHSSLSRNNLLISMAYIDKTRLARPLLIGENNS
jgi:hypothetical protein